MDLPQVVILAFVQGLAELLPVSSSAHVIVAEKLMGLDPTVPQMTLLLVMLHTGTMFAVIVFFWQSWRATYFGSVRRFRRNAVLLVIATTATGVVGLILLQLIRHIAGRGSPEFEIETLFGNSALMATSLAATGVLIVFSSRFEQRGHRDVTPLEAAWIGTVQGLCLPFRGVSRSGATISTGLILGVTRRRAEEFSFALAVVLTPVAIAREVYRLFQASALPAADAGMLWSAFGSSLFGAMFAFVGGLVALRWLTRWLEQGRWHFFGGYCLAAAAVVLWVG